MKAAVAALGVGAAAAVGVRTVFGITERPSWPPSPGAITGDRAKEAVAEFAASDPGPGDVGLPYGWSTAAGIEPWGGGVEFYPRMLEDLEAARSSIHILMFGWKPGEPATAIADVLVAKLAAGVEVRVIVDGFGSRPYGLSKEMYTRLAEAGAQIVVNNFLPPRRAGLYPDATARWRNALLCRYDHRKLYVVDGTVAWTGGAGIEDHFLDGRFFDVMVRVTGDVVRLAQSVFLTSFAGHGAPLPPDLAPYFPPQPDPGATPATVTQVVHGGHVSATQAARELIDGSTYRLDVMNPYFTDADMVGRIIAAAERGVAVDLVVSRTSNNALASAALRHRYPDLLEAGVAVWEYPGAVVHAKLIVADDRAQFGTLNLDAWSLYRAFEIAMVVDSADAAARFRERIFGPAIARCETGRPPTTVGSRAMGIVGNRLAYFL
ncbi:phospholipase D-like domain-containing protein [Ilumatobacter sp.]|uniref:phospholipase D-like domain-containing protein n=1 Tax=Ilumatobacter sp. TaxID=1967498 RepID=UPI003AF8F060